MGGGNKKYLRCARFGCIDEDGCGPGCMLLLLWTTFDLRRGDGKCFLLLGDEIALSLFFCQGVLTDAHDVCAFVRRQVSEVLLYACAGGRLKSPSVGIDELHLAENVTTDAESSENS